MHSTQKYNDDDVNGDDDRCGSIINICKTK